ncbi:MAG TPA: sulfite exporter TauE/SafE family protein [Spirochaetales bacterium]|nr:sulfite exporter TauE/SafE family protein [Spirochaetales bacterium]
MIKYLFTGFVFFLAGFVQGLTGFAFALLAVPLLSLIGPLRNAVGLVASVALISILYSYYLHKKEVSYREILPLSLFAVALIPLGAIFLVKMPEHIATIALGLVIVTLAVFSLKRRQTKSTLLQKRWIGFLFAGISGLLGGAFSAPGPIVIAYLYATNPSPLQAKANTQLFFTFTSVALFLVHLIGGTITAPILFQSIPLIPISLLGTHLGVRLSRILPTPALSLLTNLGMIVLGIYLIVSRFP